MLDKLIGHPVNIFDSQIAIKSVIAQGNSAITGRGISVESHINYR